MPESLWKKTDERAPFLLMCSAEVRRVAEGGFRARRTLGEKCGHRSDAIACGPVLLHDDAHRLSWDRDEFDG